jgi:NAD(P)-dependent dehydrogenase (short-subunit alcohol dehydrogenase family)
MEGFVVSRIVALRPPCRPCANALDKRLATRVGRFYLRAIERLEPPMTRHRDSSNTPLRVAITGGTAGLGRALVEAWRARGAQVAFVARHADRVAAVAGETGAHGIAGDVSKKDDIHPIALQINAALGGVDVLVHNASSLGPVPLALLADTGCEDFETALATNLLGPFRLTRALLGALAAAARAGRPAVVVLITSDAAITPYAGWGAYAASKAALVQMGRVWDEELRRHGIAVIAIDPGDMDTDLHALAVPDADRSQLKRPEDAAREIVQRVDEIAARSEEPA